MKGRVPHVGYSKFPTVQINLPNLFFTAITYALNQWYETYMGQSFSQVISFVSTSKKYCARNFLKTVFVYTNRYYLTFFYKYISKWLYKFESLMKLSILNLFKLYYSQRKLVEDRLMRRAMVVGDGFSNTSRKNQCA